MLNGYFVRSGLYAGLTKAPCCASPARAMSTWTGTGKTQEDLMRTDQCILVDGCDQIVGGAAKVDAHRFVGDTPTGRLHRAFSVFLFDNRNRLLLQQRALSKVWTNTCCSHQLHGQDPSEIDETSTVGSGRVPGAIRAAIRKLEHELGIPQSSLEPGDFRFLTRLVYCAPDRAPDGTLTGWGEHEMDYILFVRADVPIMPNPDEVADVQFVSPDELEAMMRMDSGLKWSPWFRIIAERFLRGWWHNLPATLHGQHNDWGTIHNVLADGDSERQ